MSANPQPPQEPQPQEGQIIPFEKRFNRFATFMDRMKGQLARALPKHLAADRMIRIILTTVRRVPELLDCTPESMLGAVLQCSQLGLEPDGVLGQAYLIPFYNSKAGCMEVQLVVGYKGLIRLAYQSGEVGSIRARVVRQKDRFQYWYGLDEGLVHEPHRGSDPGDLVAVYAVAKIKGIDEPQFLVLERWEVDAIRARSKAAKSGPWVTDYEPMAMKSGLRRLCKMLPASVEKDNLARAIALDERAEAGISQELENIIDVTAEPPADKPQEQPPTGKPQEQAGAAEGPGEAAEPPAAAKPSKLDNLAAEARARRQQK